tara:strand:- start:255 stop:560 length:306 start_codon:yes stop_codon:yes gene_type:complete
MRVKIEIIRKYLRDNAAFQYNEDVLKLWEKETLGDVSLPELADMMRKATRDGQDVLLPSEIGFLFYKALQIKEEMIRYTTDVDTVLLNQKEMFNKRIQRGI